MKTEKILASVLASTICFTAAVLPFGNAQKTAYAHSTTVPKSFTSLFSGTELALGDVNGDESVNSTDASKILIEYSISLTGGESTFTDAQRKAGDVDGNGSIDSKDASAILIYYAYVSTGGKLSMKEYLEAIKPPAVTTAPVSSATTAKPPVTTVPVSESTTAKPPVTTVTVVSTAKPTVTTVPVTNTAKPPVTTVTVTNTAKPPVTTVTVTSTAKPPVTTVTVTSTAKPPVTTVTVTSTAKPPVTTAPVTTSSSPVLIKVSDIRITRTEMSVNVGEGGLAAYVTMLPASAANKDEIWSSSDESIAIVDNEGWVVGVKEGKCIITVKSADNPSVSAQIAVTVNDTRSVKDIRLSRTSMTIQAGYGDLAANVTMLPATAVNKNEKWSSSDESIAIVDNEGWVIAKKPGNAVITVQSVDNPAVFAFVLVTVTDAGSPTTQPLTIITTTTTVSTVPVTTTTETTVLPVEEIKIDETELTLSVGEQKDTHANVLPEGAGNKTLNWTSSDEKVATVDKNGRITAVGAGNCIITANSAENGNIKANVIVNVKSVGEVTQILLSKYEMKLSIGSRDISRITILPASATNKDELWTTSDPSVATVDKYGWVCGVSKGECVITVFSADNPSVKAEIAVTVVDGPVDDPNPVDFSSIAPGKSTNTHIAFMMPVPQNASGRYVVDYIITDSNGKVTTISTSTIVAPTMKTVITMLTAETNEFTAEAVLTNLATNKQATIGKYSFVISPRDAMTETENIYAAFNAVE